jgi:hypothetical protein
LEGATRRSDQAAGPEENDAHGGNSTAAITLIPSHSGEEIE